MSWHLTVTNKYHGSVQIPNLTVLPPNAQPFKVPSTLGHIVVIVDGLGPINFTDVADKQIGGYSKATWGVLISYQGEELIFRYEGGGDVQLTINEFGQAEIITNGSISQIKLSSFVVK
jgi:hypothetical protein